MNRELVSSLLSVKGLVVNKTSVVVSNDEADSLVLSKVDKVISSLVLLSVVPLTSVVGEIVSPLLSKVVSSVVEEEIVVSYKVVSCEVKTVVSVGIVTVVTVSSELLVGEDSALVPVSEVLSVGNKVVDSFPLVVSSVELSLVVVASSVVVSSPLPSVVIFGGVCVVGSAEFVTSIVVAVVVN